jgi:hypothetical protein
LTIQASAGGKHLNEKILIMSNFNSILEQIEPWSLFELNRLHSAIGRLLDDTAKNEAIKYHLKVGMKINYFNSDTNSLIEATIVEIRKTRVSVVNIHDGKRWNIKFSLINLQGIDINIAPKRHDGNLNRNSLKVGDSVGWNSKLGCDLYGIIEKLNPKKALIRLGNGELWTVSYSLLFLVMDGVITKQNNQLYFEGEVIR